MQQTVTATTTTDAQEVDEGLRGEFQCMRLWRPDANPVLARDTWVSYR
jgi:hypothetical protein